MDNYKKSYHRVVQFTLLLAIFVIMLGAYTRLGDAGLGCPDWPGCYGQMTVPTVHDSPQFPNQPVEPAKAWKEMVHRYCAGTLGLLIVGLALAALWGKFRNVRQPIIVPMLLVALLIFQAILGMWTVTLKLLPLVVMGHLMGGMCIAGLLCWLLFATRPDSQMMTDRLNLLRPWVLLGLLIVILQIFLGAWTSTNYAALACPDFPYCQGVLFPPMDWHRAFNFTSPIGPNYEGGQLTMEPRMTIHMAHRYGAFLTVMYLIPLALSFVWIKEFRIMRRLGWLILILLVCQIALGILNVVMSLPLPIAVAHNGMAALLLLAMVIACCRLFPVSLKSDRL